MIDIHSHIIPFMDDGAASIEEAVKMAVEAKKNGVNKIICTPHYISGSYENNNIKENFELLKRTISDKKIDLELYLGNEIMFSVEGFEAIKNGKAHTLAHSRYLLIELYMVSKKILEKGIEILLDMGYIPILAHIERYRKLDVHFFKSLREKGVLFQCNLASLKDPRSAKNIKTFLDADIIDFFASDAHSVRYRTYDIWEYISELEKFVGHEKAKLLLYKNAEKIIRNEEIKKEKIYAEKNTGNTGNFSSVFSNLFKRIGIRRSFKQG